MANEITVATLGDAVRDRVKKAIFDSIPDAAIESLINAELKKLTDTEEVHWNGKYQRVSQLQRIIGDEFKKQLCERAQKQVGEYLDLTYQNQSKELVDKAIKEIAPLFLAGMAERFAEAAASGLRQQLSQKGIYF
jgi:UDP-N-acetyl-D-mannosaminuronic acid transferase (WecB/TagA/CpsF family)